MEDEPRVAESFGLVALCAPALSLLSTGVCASLLPGASAPVWDMVLVNDQLCRRGLASPWVNLGPGHHPQQFWSQTLPRPLLQGWGAVGAGSVAVPGHTARSRGDSSVWQPLLLPEPGDARSSAHQTWRLQVRVTCVLTFCSWCRLMILALPTTPVPVRSASLPRSLRTTLTPVPAPVSDSRCWPLPFAIGGRADNLVPSTRAQVRPGGVARLNAHALDGRISRAFPALHHVIAPAFRMRRCCP